jgi:hypothetical protein
MLSISVNYPLFPPAGGERGQGVSTKSQKSELMKNVYND